MNNGIAIVSTSPFNCSTTRTAFDGFNFRCSMGIDPNRRNPDQFPLPALFDGIFELVAITLTAVAVALRALTLHEKGTDLCARRQGIMGPGARHGQRSGGVAEREGLVEIETAGQLAGEDSRERIPRPDRLDDRYWPGGKVVCPAFVERDHTVPAECHDHARHAEPPPESFTGLH